MLPLENIDPGTVGFVLSGEDPEFGDFHFALCSNNTEEIFRTVNITRSGLGLPLLSPNAETRSEYSLWLCLEDDRGAKTYQHASLLIDDLDDMPTLLSKGIGRVNETAEEGEIVFSLWALDEDDDHILPSVSIENSLLEVRWAGKLKCDQRIDSQPIECHQNGAFSLTRLDFILANKSSLDFEKQDLYGAELTLTANHKFALFDIRIEILDGNDRPEFVGPKRLWFPENRVDIPLGTVHFFDQDFADLLEYEFIGCVPIELAAMSDPCSQMMSQCNEYFDVDAHTGELWGVTSVDYERDPQDLLICVAASDGLLSSFGLIEILLLDNNDPPLVVSTEVHLSVPESVSGIEIADMRQWAWDQDNDTYVAFPRDIWPPTAKESLTLDPSTGVLRIVPGKAFDFESLSILKLRIRIHDILPTPHERADFNTSITVPMGALQELYHDDLIERSLFTLLDYGGPYNTTVRSLKSFCDFDLILHVIDTNDPPIFLPGWFHPPGTAFVVVEQQRNQLVMQLNASDQDGDSLYYEIVGGSLTFLSPNIIEHKLHEIVRDFEIADELDRCSTPRVNAMKSYLTVDQFYVDRTTGEVFTSNTSLIDYEDGKPQFTLMVRVYDNGGGEDVMEISITTLPRVSAFAMATGGVSIVILPG